MSEDIPTTEQVRYHYSDDLNEQVVLRNNERFDRWLAEHDRIVIWKYLRERLKIEPKGENSE